MNSIDSVSFWLLANEINKVYEKSYPSLSRIFLAIQTNSRDFIEPA